jgi:hypothetical protein
MNMNRPVRLIAVACVSLAMLGCMTMQPLTVDSTQLARDLKEGDRVQVVTKSGKQVQFKIEGVDAQGLRGEGEVVAYNDIESINREQIAMGKTALIVIGVAAVAAAAASGGGGSGSGY